MSDAMEDREMEDVYGGRYRRDDWRMRLCKVMRQFTYAKVECIANLRRTATFLGFCCALPSPCDTLVRDRSSASLDCMRWMNYAMQQ